MDKTRLRQAILDRLAADLETQTRAALMARDEATHEESKAENQYDMHAQEAAYLAEGQARIAAELRESIALYHSLPVPGFAEHQPVDVGAVVTLEAAGLTLYYFLGPKNGGMEIPFGELTLLLITPQSPLGQRLVGRRAGDLVSLPGRGASTRHRILKVE